ncbi:MAG: ATP synthase F1 subunit gamma [Patescibacteria group bacterium]
MESVQNLKKRLKAVNNIHHITKAMELVAATKMRKSQEIAIASRPYSFAALDLLANLAKQDIASIPILAKREIKKTLLVLIASDKGLVGSFNSNVFKTFEKFIKEQNIDVQKPEFYFLAIGEKADGFLRKKGAAILAKFVRVGDYAATSQSKPIAEFLINGYLTGNFDRVIIVSMNFKSAFIQQPVVRELFPVDFESIKKTAQEIIPQTGKFADLIKEQGVSFFEGAVSDYSFEPSINDVLEELVSHLIDMEIYHLILEANASEHAAKRVAMKNASDNAQNLSENLNLSYNKSRQAGITNELIELTAGAQV